MPAVVDIIYGTAVGRRTALLDAIPPPLRSSNPVLTSFRDISLSSAAAEVLSAEGLMSHLPTWHMYKFRPARWPAALRWQKRSARDYEGPQRCQFSSNIEIDSRIPFTSAQRVSAG